MRRTRPALPRRRHPFAPPVLPPPLMDSDSDLDDGVYTRTSVLLGFADDEPTDDAISHLGGAPVCVPSASPSAAVDDAS